MKDKAKMKKRIIVGILVLVVIAAISLLYTMLGEDAPQDELSTDLKDYIYAYDFETFPERTERFPHAVKIGDGIGAREPMDTVIDMISFTIPARQITARAEMPLADDCLMPFQLCANACGKSRNARTYDDYVCHIYCSLQVRYKIWYSFAISSSSSRAATVRSVSR